MLINEIEKKYGTRISHSDTTTNILESLNPLSFSVTNKGNKTFYY